MNCLITKVPTRNASALAVSGSGTGKEWVAVGNQKVKNRRSLCTIKSFEGGQKMPLYQRLPKRAFTKAEPEFLAVVNLGLIQKIPSNAKKDRPFLLRSPKYESSSVVTSANGRHPFGQSDFKRQGISGHTARPNRVEASKKRAQTDRHSTFRGKRQSRNRPFAL